MYRLREGVESPKSELENLSSVCVCVSGKVSHWERGIRSRQLTVVADYGLLIRDNAGGE